MSFKKHKKEIILITVSTILWIIYYFQAFTFFSQVKDFITPGSSYIIRLLEFTNYRANELAWFLVEYFILVSLSSMIYMYMYKKVVYNKRKVNSCIISINVIYVLIMCIVSNLFWSVYLILTLLVWLVLIASICVSNMLFDSIVKFEKDDIIFYSDTFEDAESAKKSLEKRIKEIDRENIQKISGEVFNVGKEYFFEIYANENLIIDRKGEFIIHEKDK